MMELEGNSNSETVSRLPAATAGATLRTADGDLGQLPGPSGRCRSGLISPRTRLTPAPGEPAQYSPDFNADEAIWGWARQEATANLCLGNPCRSAGESGRLLRQAVPPQRRSQAPLPDCTSGSRSRTAPHHSTRCFRPSQCRFHFGFGLGVGRHGGRVKPRGRRQTLRRFFFVASRHPAGGPEVAKNSWRGTPAGLGFGNH